MFNHKWSMVITRRVIFLFQGGAEMKPNSLNDKHIDILDKLCHLPRKILSLHGHDNITELILHELCNEQCFNLEKAAYFIDNPDFDCFKGVAGHCRSQALRSRWMERF